jgi:hypothetical protein
VLDELAAEGIFKVVGVNQKGKKRYVLTELGQNPNLHVNGPRVKQ